MGRKVTNVAKVGKSRRKKKFLYIFFPPKTFTEAGALRRGCSSSQKMPICIHLECVPLNITVFTASCYHFFIAEIWAFEVFNI